MTRFTGRLTWKACCAASALSLAVAAGATSGAGAASRDRKEDQASRDAAEVAKAIAGSAKALSDFPRTRNRGAVLSFYAKTYTVVENGEESSLEGEKELLSELLDQMEEGQEVGISSMVRNIQVRVAGKIAWATYDYEFKIALRGGDWGADEGKCTSILVKPGSAWLLEHEHCSSLCPSEECEEEEDSEAPAHERT